MKLKDKIKEANQQASEKLRAWRNYSTNVIPAVSTYKTVIGTRADGSEIMGRLDVCRKSKAISPGATMEQINQKWTQRTPKG